LTDRKKRLKRGVISLEKQIQIHEEKREDAKKQGNIELENYYEKELITLKQIKDKKQKLLNKL